MVWYSQLFKNFLQLVVIHTVKGFGIVNKAETDVFLELSCFFDDPMDVDNLVYSLLQNEVMMVSYFRDIISQHHYQRNANQIYNKVSAHTGQNGHHQKIYRQQMLEIV